MSHVYCPECGFQNPEAANYCARCGAYLRRDEHGETTLSLDPTELPDDASPTLAPRAPALVVRAGAQDANQIRMTEGQTGPRLTLQQLDIRWIVRGFLT